MVNKDALNQQISEILAHHDTLAYLPEWQVRSLVPLTLGHSVNTVAIAVGKDPKTISKMMKTGLFKIALGIAAIEVFNATSRLSAAFSLDAMIVAHEILTNKENRAGDRLKAADLILSRGDICDSEALLQADRTAMSQRIEALEKVNLVQPS